MSEILRNVAEAVERGEAPQETVRSFLARFGAQRRGHLVVEAIRDALRESALVTDPDFEAAYIDSLLTYRKWVPAVTGTGATSSPAQVTSGVVTVVPAAPSPTGPDGDAASQLGQPFLPNDPSFRLSKLAAANNPPMVVAPTASLQEAVTKMLSNNFSQLPIMSNERDVRGVVSWRSIASRLATGASSSDVSSCADPVEIIDASASLFAAVTRIVEHQFVLVRAPDRRIVGIVTASDLSAQFQALTEPFLLLSEIENELRRIIQSRFDSASLGAAKDPADESRSIETVHDMTFGEYVRLLEKPERWAKLGISLDRKSFIADLIQVRDIRNEVMHFDPDGIPADNLQKLRKFSAFLARLRTIGVTGPG